MRELSTRTRGRHLEAMAEDTLDVLVVGGGITGAGVALDAAARGLSVGLVEREDFAAGTSGRSSRLIHGGIRYLRHGEVGLVRESLRERDLLVLLAPHLVRPMPFLVPVRRLRHRAPIRAALALYDLLAVGGDCPPHRRVDDEEGRRLAPALARGAAGYVYWDARTDDARLTVEVMRQAALRGALVANHAEVRDLLGEAAVRGARVVDRLSGGEVEVRARIVVNAAGAWADRVHGLARREGPRLRPSKGVHLVFDRSRIPLRGGLLVPSLAERGAFIFVVPWGARVYAGTTDTPFEGDLDEPGVSPGDVEVVLGSIDRALRIELTEEDVLASWAGVRPLLDTGEGSTRDLSRRHVVYEDPPGLLTVTGGKLTTFRAMAEDAVDRVSRGLGKGGPCRTGEIPLGLTRPLGAALDRAAAEVDRLDLPPDLGRRLVALYGDDWEEGARLVRESPSLADPILPGLPARRVEAVLARSREMAVTDEDVVVRRTRLATMDERALGAPLPA